MPSRCSIFAAAVAGLGEFHATVGQRAGDDVQRRHARNGAQELRDIAQRGAADLDDLAPVGALVMSIIRAVMADENLAVIDQIIAVQAAQQRGFAGARRAGQATHSRAARSDEASRSTSQLRAGLQMQGEGFGKPIGLDENVAHVGSTEETRSCVYACCGSSST